MVIGKQSLRPKSDAANFYVIQDEDKNKVFSVSTDTDGVAIIGTAALTGATTITGTTTITGQLTTANVQRIRSGMFGQETGGHVTVCIIR